jgi:RNA polymerase sigma-70 factor (ECF subfamily)
MERLTQEDWERFQQGVDERAFERLYERTSTLVYTICLRKLKNEEDALDAFQATYIQLLALARESVALPEGTDIDLEIRRLARREADRLRLRRSRRAQREVVMDSTPEPRTEDHGVAQPATPSASDTAAGHEMRAILEALIRTLPEKYHLPLLFHYFDGMTHDEIARTLDLPRSTVTHRILRGLKRLRPLLRRAGVLDATAALSALAVAGALIHPPSSVAAGTVFREVLAALSAGQGAGATFVGTAGAQAGISAIKVTLVAGISAAVFVTAMVLLSPGPDVPVPAPSQPVHAATASTGEQTAPATPPEPALAPPGETEDGSVPSAAQSNQAATQSASPAEAETGEQVFTFRAIWRVTGEPAPDTAITITRAGTIDSQTREAASATSAILQATTDASGLAELRLPGGWTSAQLEVVHPDSARVTRTLDAANDTAKTDNEPTIIRLDKGVSVFGRLWYEETGAPAAGKEVRLHQYAGGSCGGPPLLATAIAAEDGLYRFKHIDSGQLLLRAEQDEWVFRLADDAPQFFRASPGQAVGPYDLFLQKGAVLTGRVRNRDTRMPIADALVEFGTGLPKICRTDSQGTYRLVGIPEMQLELQVAADGFVEESPLVSPKLGETLTLDFDLEPGVQVEVLVTDADGNPIEGARVYREFGGTWYGESSDRTDPNGRYVVPNYSRARDMKITARKAGYRDNTEGIPSFGREGQPGRVELVLESRGENVGVFTGHVTDYNGTPLAGIDIEYGSPWGNNDSATVTDEEGAYRLEVTEYGGLPMLFAHGEGWAPDWTWHIEPGTAEKPHVHDFTLQPGHWLEGRVVDEEGNPVGGAVVEFFSHGKVTGTRVPGVPLSIRTDETGSFYQSKLPGPTVGLEVYGTGWTQWEEKQMTVDHDVEIVLQKAGVFRGRLVVKKTGEPVTDFLVRVRGNGIWTTRYEEGHRFSDPEGKFVLEELDAGTPYKLTFEAEDYPPLTVPDQVAVSPDATEEPVFELVEGDVLEGVAVDAQTGAPVPGVAILYAETQRYQFIGWDSLEEDDWNLTNRQKTVTEAEGAFSFEESDTPGWLFIRCPGCQRIILPPDDRIVDPDTGKVIIEMKPESVITGRCFENGKPSPGQTIHISGNRNRPSDPVAHTEYEEPEADSQGRYRLGELPPGNFTVSWFKREGMSSFGAMQKSVHLSEDEELTVDLGDDLGNLALRGCVLDRDKPLPGTSVRLTPRFEWGYRSLADHTDEEGRYEITGLKPGTYNVDVNSMSGDASQRKRQQTTLTLTSDLKRDFTFLEKHRVTGRVVAGEGGAMPGDLKITYAQLIEREFRQIRNQSAASNGEVDRIAAGAVTDNQLQLEGRFHGDYFLELTVKRGERTSRIAFPEPFDLDTREGDQDLGNLLLPQTGKLEVKIDSPIPIPEGKQSIVLPLLQDDSANPAARLTQRSSWPGVFTLERRTGSHTVEDVPLGTYTAKLLLPGFKSEPTELPDVTIEPGRPAAISFTLVPVGEVTGFARAPSRNTATLTRVRLTGTGISRELVPTDDLEELQDQMTAGKDFAGASVFRFTELPAGEVQLTIEAEGCAPYNETLTVQPGTPIQREINLRPASTESTPVQ